MIPLTAVSHYRPDHTPLSVNHQGLFVASTISFNLQPGKALGDGVAEIQAAIARINMPHSIRGTLAGTAQLFQQSLAKEPILILTAIAAVYILLGVLYESYIHPITILSTLPSAGVGALLALMACNTDFDIIGLIGVILLIGIVKKNAIMMIDFAIEAKRSRRLSSHDAIYEACLLRFRPIMMTTSAAILGAFPLALSFGNGGEIRRPLGIAIVGGLLISQLLTLYTTPVVLSLSRPAQRLVAPRAAAAAAASLRSSACTCGVDVRNDSAANGTAGDAMTSRCRSARGCSSTASSTAIAPDREQHAAAGSRRGAG